MENQQTPSTVAGTARQRRDCDRIWRRYLNQPAQITDEQARKMTINFQRQIAWSYNTRRLALAALTRTGRELEQAFGKDASLESAQSAAVLVASASSLRDFLRGVVDCLETAVIRVEMAMLERADMEDLIGAARASPPQSETPA